MPEHQYSLPGLEPVTEFDFVFFALPLEIEDAGQIEQLRARLCREHGLNGRPVPVDRLHISLHALGGWHGLSRAAVRTASEVASKVSTRRFEIVFDRVMSFTGGAFVLRASSDVALLTFHRTLGVGMKRAGIGQWVTTKFTPHMTLLYGDRLLKELSIEPIKWTVRNFVLVQSLRGRGHSKHIHLARWPLRS